MQHRHSYSQVNLVQLLPNDVGTFVPTWHWHGCSFPSDADTIVPKWRWHNCSQMRLTLLFSSETGTIVPKWYWHSFSNVKLAWLLRSDAGVIVSKWHLIAPRLRLHKGLQAVLVFAFFSCFLISLLAQLFTSELHLPNIVTCTRIMVDNPNENLLVYSFYLSYTRIFI